MISSTSGLLIDTTEDGTDGKCCPGRDTDAPALGTWNQLAQSKKSFYTKSNSAIESLNTFFTTSGEYISIHPKPWIISKEKGPSLQWWCKPHKIVTFGRLPARAHATNDTPIQNQPPQPR